MFQLIGKSRVRICSLRSKRMLMFGQSQVQFREEVGSKQRKCASPLSVGVEALRLCVSVSHPSKHIRPFEVLILHVNQRAS